MARKATQKDADGVEFMFRALAYPQLRARAAADHVLIETGPLDAPIARIRLRKVSAEDWRVEMLFDTRWEKTPNVGPRGNMVAAICDLFNQQKDGKAWGRHFGSAVLALQHDRIRRTGRNAAEIHEFPPSLATQTDF